MKNLFLVMIVAFGLKAHAGNDAGHGGGAYICPNPAESEFLDLLEARIDGLQVNRSNLSVDQQIANVLKKMKDINPAFADRLSSTIAGLPSKVRNSPVKFPEDAYEDVTKNGCDPKGIGRYSDLKELLYVDQALLATLPLTDQAAFWVHEGIYKILRDTESTLDSRKARSLVGYLFSTKVIASVFDGIPKDALKCVGANGTEYFLWLDRATETYTGQVIQLADAFVFGKTNFIIIRVGLTFYLETWAYQTPAPEIKYPFGISFFVSTNKPFRIYKKTEENPRLEVDDGRCSPL